VGKITEELTCEAKTFVDLEGPVEIRVVNETLPSDSRAGFFEISPHDNEEIAPFGNLGSKEFGVVESLLRRMDGTGANDHEKSIVVSGQDPRRVVASRGDSLLGGRRRDDLVTE